MTECDRKQRKEKESSEDKSGALCLGLIFLKEEYPSLHPLVPAFHLFEFSVYAAQSSIFLREGFCPMRTSTKYKFSGQCDQA